MNNDYHFYYSSTSSFNTYFIYFFLKSFLSIKFPETKSTDFNINDKPKIAHPTKNKNIVCKWNPYSSPLTDSLISPIISGNTPSARFMSTSIIPNAVPKSLGFTIIGKVGIITVQKSATPMPIVETGTHLIHSSFLNSASVYT